MRRLYMRVLGRVVITLSHHFLRMNARGIAREMERLNRLRAIALTRDMLERVRGGAVR